MSWGTPDVYYQPESFGLQTLGSIEWSEPNYDFDLTAVWSKDGILYWASDAGCSCPSPFEDFTSIEQLHTGTFAELQADLFERVNFASYTNNSAYVMPQIVELLGRIKGMGF